MINKKLFTSPTTAEIDISANSLESEGNCSKRCHDHPIEAGAGGEFGEGSEVGEVAVSVSVDMAESSLSEPPVKADNSAIIMDEPVKGIDNSAIIMDERNASLKESNEMNRFLHNPMKFVKSYGMQ